MKKFMVLSLILFLAYQAKVYADVFDMPKFENPPTKYVHSHSTWWVTGLVSVTSDELIVGDITPTSLKFYISIMGTNGHFCYTIGTAVKNDDHYIFKEKKCRIQFFLKQNIAYIVVNAFKCDIYCGARAHLVTKIFTPDAGNKPGFECSNATTEMEKRICRYKELSQLDGEMSMIYQPLYSLLNAQKKKKLKVGQQKWLKTRDTCLTAPTDNNQVEETEEMEPQTPEEKINTCIGNVYTHRMHELRKQIRQIYGLGN